jgi:hypothetical protein
MKKEILIIGLLLGAMSGAVASVTNIMVKVVDETGVPIQDVKTTIVVNAQGERKKTEGVTDTNGLFSAQGGFPARIGIGGQKDGYYRSVETFYLIPDNDSVELEPWGGRTLVLERIVDPQKGMLASTRSGASWIELPAYDKVVGFDVIESDWVAPYGKGNVADFVFTFSKDTTNKTLSYVLAFSNEGDGILEYPFNENDQSIFRWPHKAPLDGYNVTMKKSLIYERSSTVLTETEEMKMDTEVNYIFRVRTKYDENGNIESALYGKVKGELGMWPRPRDELRFKYWLNIDPHSRSLESTDSMFP